MTKTITKAIPIEGEGVALVGSSGITHNFYAINEVMRVATEAFKGIVDINEIIATRAIQIDTGYEIRILADGFTPQAQNLAEEYGITLTPALRH